MAHLRSNLTLRIPRSALPEGLPNELQASALFLKGRYRHGPAHSSAFITSRLPRLGLDRPTADSEPELFKKVPSLDYFTPFLTANDDQVVITLRSIGEMEARNPNSRIRLTTPDEYSIPRAFVSINPSTRDMALWDAMDRMADDTALVFANGHPYEVMVNGVYQKLQANQAPRSVAPFGTRRDGLGTTHHEVRNPCNGERSPRLRHRLELPAPLLAQYIRLRPRAIPVHRVAQSHANGVALTRRMGDALVPPPAPFQAEAGFTRDLQRIRHEQMEHVQDQQPAPDRSNPGRFLIVDGTLEYATGDDLGLLWYTEPMPANYILRAAMAALGSMGNSGVFVRFPTPIRRATITLPMSPSISASKCRSMKQALRMAQTST